MCQHTHTHTHTHTRACTCTHTQTHFVKGAGITGSWMHNATCIPPSQVTTLKTWYDRRTPRCGHMEATLLRPIRFFVLFFSSVIAGMAWCLSFTSKKSMHLVSSESCRFFCSINTLTPFSLSAGTQETESLSLSRYKSLVRVVPSQMCQIWRSPWRETS